MKHTLLVLIALFSTGLLVGQDTTVVQTIRWSDNFRRDTFHFPDAPTQSWRKIYLQYNMRCRNGATCGEWDYSCNTFITDPSRIDSFRQTFPEYVISGFSGNTFVFANTPTFTYYRFLQHQSEFNSGTAVESSVGNGSTNLLLSEGAGLQKSQCLFTAAELTAAGLSAGNINGLTLVLSQSGAPLGFFKISLKNTLKTALSTENPDLTGFTDVFFRNTPVSNTGAVTFPFYQPFVWDGSSNLLVEWSSNTPGGSTAAVFATDAGFAAAMNNNQPDNALHFGSGSYVDIPTTSLAGISTEITVSFWNFGEASIFPVNSTIFEGNNASGARAINAHLPWSNGSVYWDCGGAGGGYDRIEKAADPMDYEGRWNHWAFTKNTVTGSMKIYLNGVLWHSGTGKSIPIDFKNLILGGSADHSLTYYGKIDAFQVWDKELDEATIAAWMRKPITPEHPDYAHLRADYSFDEGTGVLAADSSPAAAYATVNLPNWQPTRGKDLFKNFEISTLRPNTTFLQGDLTVTDQTILVLDSVLNAQQKVLHYGVSGTDLVVLDTSYYFPAGAMNVLDPETNTVIDQVQVAADDSISIQNLTYYAKRAARFELLSLVTPYGNGLSLGASGKVFTFDITDFGPILQGNKVLSVEFGGEWQEDLDLKFVFVAGKQAKPVLNIQNIWPEGRGWYQDILDDRLFEPRSVSLSNAAQHFKLRSAVTGHGQNGEFIPQQHYLNVNGGEQEFQYDVWKYCGKNPIYPQGGTWVFDRAGWCPGMATDVHEFKLNASSGSTVTLDYGLNGSPLSEANYLVSNQLVSYGAYAHALDASIESVMRPNNKQVEYARINPACSTPLILVKNNGSSTISTIRFEYLVQGGSSETYTWSGTLEPDAQIEVTLPVLTTAFWTTGQANKVFQVQIAAVNDQLDEELANNQASMTFTPAQVFSFPNPLRIRTNTNNTGGDYSYTIKDAGGNTVMSRSDMLSNTSYLDLLSLPNGCYTLNFEDAGNDGLSFWFFPENGSGSLNLVRPLASGTLVPAKAFNPDFGGGVQFDFVISPIGTGTEETDGAKFMSVYPNPASEQVMLDLRGFAEVPLEISLRDVHGRILYQASAQANGSDQFIQPISLEGIPSGMYFVRVSDGKNVWVSEVVKL
jgi:hypothetical protein